MGNVQDLMAKRATGDIRPEMTINEFLQKNFGLTGENTMIELVQAAKADSKKATMEGKLNAMNQKINPAMTGGPETEPGMESLMRGMR
jgi:hypothetical protein